MKKQMTPEEKRERYKLMVLMAYKSAMENQDEESAIIVRREIEICRKDFYHWLTHWCYTINEDAEDSSKTFDVFPDKKYIKIVMKEIENNSQVLLLKSRQMMLSWLIMSYMLWMAMFGKGKRLILQSQKERDAEELLERIREIYKRQPAFFTHDKKATKDTLLKFGFSDNACWIMGVPQGEHQVRGKTVTFYFGDEAHLNEELKECLTTVKPALGVRGKLVLVATSKYGFYWDLVHDGENVSDSKIPYPYEEPIKGMKIWTNRKNKYRVIKLHYTADPDKDPSTEKGAIWYKKVREKYNEFEWECEYEMNPEAAHGQRIYPEFEPEQHVCAPFDLDKAGPHTKYRIIDHGVTAPTAVVWIAVFHDRVVVYREHYEAEKTIDYHTDKIKEYEGWLPRNPGEENTPWDEIRFAKCNSNVEKIDFPLIDPATAKRTQMGKNTVYQEYTSKRNGLTLIYGDNSWLSGLNGIKNLLKAVVPGGSGEKFFQVFSTCKNTIHEFLNYRVNNKPGEPVTIDSPPKKQQDHTLDCIRYAVNFGLRYRGTKRREEEFVYRKKYKTKQKLKYRKTVYI